MFGMDNNSMNCNDYNGKTFYVEFERRWLLNVNVNGHFKCIIECFMSFYDIKFEIYNKGNVGLILSSHYNNLE